MNELFLVRIFAYSLFPLLLAGLHILLDGRANTTTHRIELVLMYLFAISVGANGLGGAFGHLFLPDIIAEGVGWETGSPFQLEMGYANLALGILGLIAVGKRGDFRIATIIATTIIGGGATIVHLMDIVSYGNLAPGNTIQNIGNLLDPILLIALTWWASRLPQHIAESVAFNQWVGRQQHIAGMSALGIGVGFGIGYALNLLLVMTIVGGLLGAGIGLAISQRQQPMPDQLVTENA